ncbi:uncharacterized protein LOC126842775 [Adelges cooleyi]|uniref:uncharacterized protein LOC126842775 n=1 Tax=Adelges cooleyi TaxID=133065 RepID=UPI00217FD5CD|nr:uncharacterized protein LOC126842775 [Adelges cooleyi]
MTDHQEADESWPVTENVLRALEEEIRPLADPKLADQERREDRVKTASVQLNVRACLEERVEPTDDTVDTKPEGLVAAPSRRDPVDMSRQIQVGLMSVKSAYVDGKYYGSAEQYVSRTVEELLSREFASSPPVNASTYTVGTVEYDSDRRCFLRGFAQPSLGSVLVDCTRLSVLPKDRSTVKFYSTLTASPDGLPLLTPHHFHVFSKLI